MSGNHVVIGAGPVGWETAKLLVGQGHEVVLGSRSGVGAEIDGVRRVAVDAVNRDDLIDLARGADAVYNCLNPTAYHEWERQWPPMAAALLAAAEETGAVLVTASNLYAYGPVDGAMVEGLPDAGTGKKARVRASMWADALSAHNAGRIRAVEVRASDYMGAGVGAGAHVPRVVSRAMAGKPVRVVGSPDQPHSWTDVLDMGRALATVAKNERAWGRVWHAPSNPARTQRQAIADVCAEVAREPGPVKAYPGWMLRMASVFSATTRELGETAYQFERPFILDSSAITREFGLDPTPWEQVCWRTATNRAVGETVGSQ